MGQIYINSHNRKIQIMTVSQLTSFAEYLNSDERVRSISECENFNGELLLERLNQISHADFENWKESIKKQ